MSRVVIAYVDGRPVYRDDGPGRGRCSGYGQGNTHDLTLVGSFVQGDPGAAEKHRREVAAWKAARK